MPTSRIEGILTDTINSRRYNGELLSRVELLLDDLNEILVSGDYAADLIVDSVNNWLTNHPEATTTVQDGSITAAKLADSYKQTTLGYTVKKSIGDI